MEQGADRRLAAIRDLQSAARIAQPRTDHSHVGVVVGILQQSPQHSGRHDRVVIEEQQITPGRFRGCLVVGPGEAAVRRVADQHDFREFARDHVGGAIGGAVVHDDRFEADALRLVEQRLEALAQKVTAVPIGDADGNVRGAGVREVRHPGGPPAGVIPKYRVRFDAEVAGSSFPRIAACNRHPCLRARGFSGRCLLPRRADHCQPQAACHGPSNLKSI